MRKKMRNKLLVLCLFAVLLLGNSTLVLAADGCKHPSTTSYTSSRTETRACTTHTNCTLRIVYVDTHVVCTKCSKQIAFYVEEREENHYFH